MATTQSIKAPVKTEDLGKIFEKGICMLYNTDYKGKYKYSVEEAAKYKERLRGLTDLFPACTHTAIRGGQYDFTATADENKHLSAKTTKGDGKVCPQVIGQPSRKRFCEHFSLPVTTTSEEIKTYIQSNLTALLNKYFHYTFDCDVLYYNKASDKLLYVIQSKTPEWAAQELVFSHVEKAKAWNESTTLYVRLPSGLKAIGEFQVHNHRDAIKFRWDFEALLDLFADCFTVITL